MFAVLNFLLLEISTDLKSCREYAFVKAFYHRLCVSTEEHNKNIFENGQTASFKIHVLLLKIYIYFFIYFYSALASQLARIHHKMPITFDCVALLI